MSQIEADRKKFTSPTGPGLTRRLSFLSDQSSMGRKKRSQLEAASRARQSRHPQSTAVQYGPRDPCYDEETEWTGGVNHHLSDAEGFWKTESSDLEPQTELEPDCTSTEESSDSSLDSDLDLEPLDLDDDESRAARLSSGALKKVEANRSLGYNGHSRASKYRHAQQARQKAAMSVEAQKRPRPSQASSNPAPPRVRPALLPDRAIPSHPLPHWTIDLSPLPTGLLMTANETSTSTDSVPPYSDVSLPPVNDTGLHAPLYGYLSDLSEYPESGLDSENEGSDESETQAQPAPKKRRKLDVPVREAARLKKEKRHSDLSDALKAVEKALSLKGTRFQSPLQAKRARVVQITLHLVVRNSRKLMDASAMEQKLMASLRTGEEWVRSREFPESDAKTWSLLNDPEIKEELVAFLRSNKRTIDPAKLVEYSKCQMATEEMKKYVQDAVNKEMPRGLKRYLELELFPRIGYKVVKKGLFYDGHERPDVVAYRQNVFIPAFDHFRPLLVEYEVGNLEVQIKKPPPPPGEFQLILTPHDEMTAQANDADKARWVLQGEMPIRASKRGKLGECAGEPHLNETLGNLGSIQRHPELNFSSRVTRARPTVLEDSPDL
ncbi:hypothetical protein B0H13DRAFT_1887378 [Mycena leptocephala]|nr:hypothetical protein B0H13DRAFT_1887378 [Mycena leptocephala]